MVGHVIIPYMTPGNERCPKCAEIGKDTRGDNLRVFADGHKWCFSCGYRESGSLKSRIHSLEKSNMPKAEKSLNFPEDYIRYIPREALAWINKYKLTKAELDVNKVGWSEDRKLLIFPVYDDMNQIIYWQGRDFMISRTVHEAVRRPKWFSGGSPANLLHIIGPSWDASPTDATETIILTEDVVSAIKVGRVYPAMPIWGSSIPLGSVRMLFKRFKRVGIWLDPDKTLEAVKSAIRASQFGDAFVVTSTQDPKYYDINYITEFVENSKKRLYLEE